MSDKRAQFIDTAAVLIVSDLKRSWAWYRDRLGFEVSDLDWSVNPRFCIAEKEGASVMLRQGDRAGTPNRHLVPEPPIWDAYVWVRDIDKLAEALKSRKTPIHSGPVKMPHGCTELTVVDPDDFLIGFGYCP